MTAPEHSTTTTPSLTNKSRLATAPQQPRNVRQQPEDDYSDSSGGLSGFEYPTWYSSIENNGYYPGNIKLIKCLRVSFPRLYLAYFLHFFSFYRLI